ncbi:MAG: metallophosphoesterase [Candidatus Hydrogenedentes bacterium]|nr:metallophosphoesterase [Candidatus Hydrogenedentota bacterium]
MRRLRLRFALVAPCLAVLAALALPGVALRAMAADAAPVAAPIAIGPYVQDVTPTSAVVRWVTIAAPRADEKASDPEQPRLEFHEKALTGLKPSTVCTYDVLGKGAPEGTGSFTTFPEGAQPFRFAVLGDTRTRHDVHQKIVNRIIAEKPLLTVNTGDLVGNGTKFSDWEQFFRINHELMRTTPYVAALGNHEKNTKTFFESFRDSEGQRYYSFRVGDALFLMLDSEGPSEESADARVSFMKQQKEWVEKTLAENEAAGFVFAFLHKPLYCVMSKRLEEVAERRAFWGNTFERNGVQVVLNGHDHHYHRAVHGGTNYVTTAGGGAPLYEIDAIQPETVKTAKVEHFVLVDVALDKAVIDVIDIDGNTVEKFEVAKRKL